MIMARRTTRPNEVTTGGPIQFDMDSFIANIWKGEYVLLVGNEIMMDKNQNIEACGNSHKYLLHSVIEQLQGEKVLHEEFSCSSFDELSLYYNKTRTALLNNLRNYTECLIDEVNPDLLKLIGSKCFRMVITTTFDPYIELIMRKVWGDSLRVMDIFSSRGSEFDFNISYENGKEYYTIQPTLIYAFGKADPQQPNKDFVLTDNDIIKCISKWLSEQAPQNLIKYINTKRLLSVGCKLDDWCFRFFWYALRKLSDLRKGDIALSLDMDRSDSDRKLHHYLIGQEVHVEPDANAFLSKIVKILNEDSKIQEIAAIRKTGGIFISYTHEDFAVAQSVFYKLSNLGYSVWLDQNNLGGGDEYTLRIQNAINDCNVFLPILSGNVRRDLIEGNHRYYMDEWKWATGENSEKKIVPIQILGYDCRESYHKSSDVPVKMQEVTMFDWQKQPFEDLTKQLAQK